MEQNRGLDVKMKTSFLYRLCDQLYGKEFSEMFTAPRKDFRKWLNEKTGCEADHITDLPIALDTWIAALQRLIKVKKP